MWCDCDKCASTISLLSCHIKEKRKIWCKQAIFIGVLLISFVFSELGTARTNIVPATPHKRLFFHQYFPSSIFNKLLRSHNFAFQSFSLTSTWWFCSEKDKQNNWIHFWPITSQSFIVHCSTVTKKSPLVCSFVGFLVNILTNNSMAHVNDSKILK